MKDVEELIKKYGEVETNWILGQFLFMEEEIDDPCIDNYRIADITNNDEMNKYDECYNNGCCGFYDKEIISPQTGKTYKIGCNYGH